MSQPVVFRPRGGMILAWIVIAACGFALVLTAISDGFESVRWGFPLLLVAWITWLAYVRPRVEISDGFVEVRNLLRTHRVPFGDIDEVESRFALTLRTRGGRSIRAWAAPAPSARAALSTRREEVSRTPGDGDTRRPSDSENSLSGGASALVRRNLEQYRRLGGTDLVGGTVTTWSIPLSVVTVFLVAASVLTFVLPHA